MIGRMHANSKIPIVMLRHHGQLSSMSFSDVLAMGATFLASISLRLLSGMFSSSIIKCIGSQLGPGPITFEQ